MRPIALSDEIAVGEMPAADEIAILAKAGFRSILNVQPDDEVPRVLTAAAVGQASGAVGLSYAHVAIASRRPDEASLRAFAGAMAQLPKPIYGCCYSGARAAAAWALTMAPEMAPHEIETVCTTAGFDMTSLRAEILRRHETAHVPVAVQAAPEIKAAAVSAGADTSTAARLPASSAAGTFAIWPRAGSDGGFAVSG